jgi:hypothetical protein
MALAGQSEEDASGAEDVAVDGRERGRDDYRVQDVRGRGDAQPAEDLHEGAAVAADFVPGEEAHEHPQGEDVEQQDAHGNSVDRLGDHLFRVGGLAGGNAEGLDPAEGEHHHGEGGQQPFKAEREEPAVLHEVAQAGSDG